MQRAILICGCAALALVGCSKKTEPAAAGGQPPAAAPTATPAAPAAPPSRKAGLWEQSMAMPGVNQTIKMCVDEATEAKAKWWSTEGRGKSDCAEQSVTPTPGGWAFHAVCATGDGAKVTSDGTATGDFGSHYKVDVTSVTSGSSMAQANGTHKVSIESTWKGPCPEGMKGGDMEMPGGMRISASGGPPHVEGGPMGLKPGQVPSQADIAKMRAQAMDMAKAMKAQQGADK